MLSRVANSVYWLHRYIERAGNVARFVDVNENLTLGENDALGAQWSPLISVTGDEDRFYERYRQPTRENVLHFSPLTNAIPIRSPPAWPRRGKMPGRSAR